MQAAAPILFSIIALIIRSPQVDQQEYSYSVDIQINTTCSSKLKSNITLIFQSKVEETKLCIVPFKHNLTCKNLTYGVDYTINGYFTCGNQNSTLSEIEQLYGIATPKYMNSTSSPTSINTRFFLPGLFYQLIVEITSMNQTCSIKHSSTTPFYNCSFWNLPSAQSFDLTYYSVTESNQTSYGNATIVYTELEDLNFSCALNETNEQIAFYWTNFTSSGYTDLTISLAIRTNKTLLNISCDPYLSQESCSTKQYQLKPGRKYQITAKLEKILPNYNREKLATCSIIIKRATPIVIPCIIGISEILILIGCLAFDRLHRRRQSTTINKKNTTTTAMDKSESQLVFEATRQLSDVDSTL